MLKNELLKKLSFKTSYPQYACERFMDALRETVEEALVDGDDVIIRGFLTIKVTDMKSRVGYNPMTGELEEFKPVKSIRCKISDSIKEAVNNNGDKDKADEGN